MLAATISLPCSKACEHAHRLARAIDSLAQMQALFADVPMLLLDATGRPCLWAHAAVDRLAD